MSPHCLLTLPFVSQRLQTTGVLLRKLTYTFLCLLANYTALIFNLRLFHFLFPFRFHIFYLSSVRRLVLYSLWTLRWGPERLFLFYNVSFLASQKTGSFLCRSVYMNINKFPSSLLSIAHRIVLVLRNSTYLSLDHHDKC